ncbi:hypothetical protein QQF64_022797 [Cirrhinus molitorella]|uniref:Uncharacterized protein n=1 Tax=Cirrhinus molitorella TaxID=172907 RepID=A0ABR3L5U4_9TELE
MLLVCFSHTSLKLTGAIQPNKPSAIFHSPLSCRSPRQINRSGDKITHSARLQSISRSAGTGLSTVRNLHIYSEGMDTASVLSCNREWTPK